MLIFRRTIVLVHLKRVTIPDAVLIQLPPEDEHKSARNVQRNITNVLK